MKRYSFSEFEKPLLTCMVQGATPERVEQLMAASLPEGAEAFGLQFCRLPRRLHTPAVYRRLLDAAGDLPTYVTDYRWVENEGLTDEELAEEMLTIAACGADLCDVMGDMFAPCEDQLTMDPAAVEKQMAYIDRLHQTGAKVLISSHVLRFIPAERVLEIALEQQRRGADIVKIVTGAESREEELENLRITALLQKKLSIPFLFLSGGSQTGLHRRIGPMLGCCMFLCVHEHDELATPQQPLLKNVRLIRDHFIDAE